MESMLNTAVTQYHVKAIDYDLEAKEPFDKTKMQNLVDATNAELTKDPNLDISLTLPVVPDDKITRSKFWGSQADFSADAAQIFAQFQKTPIINIRAYNFGPYYNPTGGDYVKVIEGVETSTDTYWSNIFKVDPTQFMQKDEEVTTMIGRSDQTSKQAILTSQLAQRFAS